uniref:Phosphatase and actin regulator n=1 Tax=Acanthochromis polyacanthus TaxID=80966 RepID=A0A3Q1FZH8_9TELE
MFSIHSAASSLSVLLSSVLQLKLQQRRTREELVSQGIMPPLKSSASFHEQRRSLERARTEDYLKRKIRSRPERSELIRMHILEETLAEPSLQAKQLQLKRARLADNLNDKIAQRPGPMELIHKNILPVHSSIRQYKYRVLCCSDIRSIIIDFVYEVFMVTVVSIISSL